MAVAAGRPTQGERITALEVKVSALKDTTELGFREVKDAIAKQSLNGRTERAKAMVDEIGNPEDVATLKALIRQHEHRQWLLRPLPMLGALLAAPIVTGIVVGVVVYGFTHHWTF